jgi:hypothetical protein
VFELSDVKLNCSITFNVITSFAKDKPVAPLDLFSKNNKVSEVVESLKAFAKTNKSSEWITKNDGLYLISEGTTGVSVLSIGLDSNKAFSFYTGFASDVSFTETVKLITEGTEHAWPSPNAAMFYSYKKDAIQMSYTLPMKADWWLKNFDKIAATDINKIVQADTSTTLEYTPVISNSGVLLLMKQSGKNYKFFNMDKTPYFEKGKHLICKEI